MNEGREQKGSDVSAMMDLFRAEVKRHALTINDGLQALAADPDSLDRLHVMIPAIQARIKVRSLKSTWLVNIQPVEK